LTFDVKFFPKPPFSHYYQNIFLKSDYFYEKQNLEYKIKAQHTN